MVCENWTAADAAWRAMMRFVVDQTEAISADAVASSFLPDFLQSLSDPCERVVLVSMQTFQPAPCLIARAMPQAGRQGGSHATLCSAATKEALDRRNVAMISVLEIDVDCELQDRKKC